jgi:carbon storage regulator CsrA
MLVLSRKAGEQLVIGDDIVIEVVRVKGNRVTLGVVAPQDVKILRAELAPRGKANGITQGVQTSDNRETVEKSVMPSESPMDQPADLAGSRRRLLQAC